MTLHIAKWGNRLDVRLEGLKDGDPVQMMLTADGSLTIRTSAWSRSAFASELEHARQDIEMGSSVMEALRSGER